MHDNQMTWVRARRCDSGLCVEVANAGHAILIGDSRTGALPLAFTREEWDVFVEGVKAGDFDKI